jgi:hypothetical protein
MSLAAYTYSAESDTEDLRTTWRRRLQQRRCLVCGARNLVNQATSYFCPRHIRTHRYCSTCETLRTAEAHGRDSRCRECANSRATAAYHADPDRTQYRLKLAQMARRSRNRADEIFDGMRRRIALAALVASTPGMSWEARGRLLGCDATNLAERYRLQCRGAFRGPDAGDRILRSTQKRRRI